MNPLASQCNQEHGGGGWERIPGTVGQVHDSLTKMEMIINIPKRCKKVRSSCGYQLKARCAILAIRHVVALINHDI